MSGMSPAGCLGRCEPVHTETKQHVHIDCLALPVTLQALCPMLQILAHRRMPEVLPTHTNHSHPTLQTHPQGAKQSKTRSMLEHLCVASCWGLLRHLRRCQLHGFVCLHSRHLLSQTAWPNLGFFRDAVWQRHLMSCCLPQPLDMWRPQAPLQFQGAVRSQVGLCASIEQLVQPPTTTSAHWLSAQPACYLQLQPPAMQ